MVKLYRILLILLFVTVGIPAVAQDAVRYPDWHDLSANERVDYNTNPAKILPDARAAFQKGEYGRTLMLCSMHWVVYGDATADARERDELDAKSKRCYDLSREMTDFISSSNIAEAKSRAHQILEHNPDAAAVRKVLEILEPQPPQASQPSQPSQPQAPSAAAAAPTAAFSAEKPATGTINGHEWVDLGLPSGLKWATCNVGANKPGNEGSYFAWGETTTKYNYGWSTYRYCSDDSGYTFTKYNTKSYYGTVDNRTLLEMSDDAARANWGGSWRMPTDAEWTELRNNCNWTWTTQDGKNGYRVTSRTNGNSIFLPAAGGRNEGSLSGAGSYGDYWSSSLISVGPYYAWNVYFNSGGVYRGDFYRCYGQSVRPVSE